MTAPILVLGAGGQVGSELMARAKARGEACIGTDRSTLDIRDAAAVSDALALHRPRLIVNCAAYTSVDRAESEPDLAAAVNAVAPATIAQAAAARGIPLLHLSTDQVFDGRKIGAYTPDDAVAPLNVYGRTKAAGEDAVRDARGRHIILRTSWVFGRHGDNFMRRILRLAAERDRLRVVADQRGCPTAAIDLAEAILAVDRQLAERTDIGGTYHFAGEGVTTWHAFAERIVAAQAPFTGRRPVVEAIRTDDDPPRAPRPMNAELDTSSFIATFGTKPRDWQVRTDELVEALVGNTRQPQPVRT